MIRKLYDKNELVFSLVLIGVYIVLFSTADALSESLGVLKSVTAAVGIISTVVLVAWIVKNGLVEKYGLAYVKFNFKQCLYFLPLALMVSVNFFGGVSLKYTLAETLFYIISMIAVGIIEELIFRGFLFKTLIKENVKTAILISSLTFGMGHIINLLNGAELFATLLQICYACAGGYLFTVIFYKTESLYPCIITHCLINALSVFADEYNQIVSALILIAVSLAYAWFILKNNNLIKKEKK